MQFALLPLDERPANTRYPTHVAAIAGVDLVLPPDDAMPFMKRPADWKRLVDWLSDRLNGCDGIVASIDLLGYGGLINSRISDDDIPTVLRAIAPLTTMRTTSRPVFAFNVIQRISNANDATEEPNYWAEYGTRLFALSQQAEGPRSEVEDKKVSDSQRPYDPTAPRPPLEGSHRATYMSGHEVKAKSRITETDIPQSILTDWRTRRARNHAVNLAMLHAAALGKFDLLIISSDDTSPIGLSARERKHLEFWRDALFPPLTPTSSSNGLGDPSHKELVLMYPGADDVGTALMARMINFKRKYSPCVFVHYADDAMRNNIAPYEDRPIYLTVETQIMAVGAQLATKLDEANVILVVSPPFPREGDRDPHHADHDPDARRVALLPTVKQIACWLEEGRQVAVADVAFPNGAEPVLVELLFEHTEVARLAAFGGWNTAGNTLGTVLGAVCVPCDDDHARQIALAHHFLEDWGYQSVVRDELRRWLSVTFGARNIPLAHLSEAAMFTAAALQPFADRILREGLPCTVNNVHHPWRRTFEVDFDIT